MYHLQLLHVYLSSPSRKKCSHEGCTNVAVRDGLCKSHGAPSKLCAIEGCNKVAAFRGMCKRHRDITDAMAKAKPAQDSQSPTNASAPAEAANGIEAIQSAAYNSQRQLELSLVMAAQAQGMLLLAQGMNNSLNMAMALSPAAALSAGHASINQNQDALQSNTVAFNGTISNIFGAFRGVMGFNGGILPFGSMNSNDNVMHDAASFWGRYYHLHGNESQGEPNNSQR